MNKAILCGWISAIKDTGYGVAFTLKTCEKGYKTKAGKVTPDITTYHTCMARGYLKDYVLSNFWDGALVEVVGKIYNTLDKKGGVEYQKTYIQVASVNLYSLFNTTPEKSGAKNKAAVGDEKPNIQTTDDF